MISISMNTQLPSIGLPQSDSAVIFGMPSLGVQEGIHQPKRTKCYLSSQTVFAKNMISDWKSIVPKTLLDFSN